MLEVVWDYDLCNLLTKALLKKGRIRVHVHLYLESLTEDRSPSSPHSNR